MPAQEAPQRREEKLAEGRERLASISPFSKVSAPAGIEVKMRGSSESPGNYREWNALARGAVSARELLDHYTGGLPSPDWTFRAASEESGVALRTGEYQDGTGVRWHVLVMSAPSFAEDQASTLTFRLTQLSAGEKIVAY